MADQLSHAELLIKYGFIKKDSKSKYEFDKKKGYYVSKEGSGYDSKDADEEFAEEANIYLNKQFFPTGYPTPMGTRYKMIYESFNMSLEELYYWSLNHIRQDMGYPIVHKITDVFSASENSAMFGQSAQRLSIQEDRASSFLRGISELIKTLFQIVRELRIIDERLDVYKSWKDSKSADATLKGLYSDFAENKGGQMQPGSIYHLSNQVGYASLPDLFFNTVIYDKNDLDKLIDDMPYNTNVKNVLKRKLYQFLIWREKTEKELYARKKFQVKYLRQHYMVIKTYMAWVKPYLKHIKRLSMSDDHLDSPDLISGFETSATEIEVMAVRPVKGSDYNAVVLMNFKFNTRPVMQYRQEYSQGPVHIGRGVMTLRSYGWTNHQIDMYKKMRDFEDRELLGLVDDQLKSAMDMLGEDLETYLAEAEEEVENEERLNKKPDGPAKKPVLERIASQESAFEPFVALFKGFAEIGSVFVPSGLISKKKVDSGPKGDPDKAVKQANFSMWLVYNNYKKAHKLLSW